ncbi:hypothetical protein ACPPVO_45360 [Dactylosporangium sp. McL0621]|uniref:hypothetical protein n=1 Tax=Dactylosporangium sp. McL0621 TaxID=3415678 RepID=UPI003CF91560
MGLVFVHGIGNRGGPAYDRTVALRDALFRRYLVARAVPELDGAEILSPMWGDLGAHLAWGHAALPADRSRERLGGAGSAAADLLALADTDGSGTPLVRAARHDPRDAIDLLYSVADLRGRDAGEIQELADLAVAFTDWFDRQPDTAGPDLGHCTDDLELLELLCRQVAPVETPAAGAERLGSRRRLHTAARAVLTAAVNGYRRRTIGGPARSAAGMLRRLAGRPVSLLIGDVMAYLAGRGDRAAPGPIVSVVARAFEEAGREGPLVIVAHSMGGNIAYDILSHFRPDLEVDTFITVGSQVGLFEELKLFEASDPGLPAEKVPRVPARPNIGRWLNVVDRADVLAYVAEPIFEGVSDYEYPSDALWAHGAYFRQPSFHDRLAARVRHVRKPQV